jgi:hypothetical protein
MPDYATSRYNPGSAPPASAGGGIDVKTLFLTAIASAAAAYTCSRLWAPGTLAAAAFTPVLVALIKEALDKSTDAVTRAVPVKGVVRSTRVGGEPYDPTLEQPAPELPEQAAPVAAERVAQAGEIQYHGGRGLRGWKLAVLTGLAGFLVCAVVFTVPELVAGGSAVGGGRDTTLFGGGQQRDRKEPAVTTRTTTAPGKTVTVPPATVTTPDPATTTTTPAAGEPGVGQPPAPQPPG